MGEFASHDALGPGELAFNLGILPSAIASLLWAVAIFWRMADDQGRLDRIDVVIVRFIFVALLASTVLYLGTILYFSVRAISGLYVQMGI